MVSLNMSHVSTLIPVLIVFLLTACAAPAETATVPQTTGMLPDYVMHADHQVRESYQYAVDHPEDFETVPCYCGCHRIGHKSELNCFISERAKDGTITFDNHASVCGICIDIAQDVIAMRSEGKSAAEVRQTIDATYSEIGPGTDTDYPPE